MVDGTHIPIIDPAKDSMECSNRKFFSSILLQGTSDPVGRFINIEVGWNGRNHNAHVFRHSTVCEAKDTGLSVPENLTVDNISEVSVQLLNLAKGAYALHIWLCSKS